jgi:hypothetical protein
MQQGVARGKVLASAQQRLAPLLGHGIDHQIEQVELAPLPHAFAMPGIGFGRDPGVIGIERHNLVAVANEIFEHEQPQGRSAFSERMVIGG